MKIVVTGSLGNISKPLTQTLVKKGHYVTGSSSKGAAIINRQNFDLMRGAPARCDS